MINWLADFDYYYSYTLIEIYSHEADRWIVLSINLQKNLRMYCQYKLYCLASFN